METKTFLKKLEYHSLVKRLKTHHFHKLPCQELITKNGVLPVVTLFFESFVSFLEPLLKSCFAAPTTQIPIFIIFVSTELLFEDYFFLWVSLKEIVRLRITNCPTREKFQLNLKIQTKRLKYLGSNVWNYLPYDVKLSENLSNFKTLIKRWNGKTCACKIYQIWSYIFLKFTPVNF